MVPRRYPTSFGGGQTKKEQQRHLVGWLPTFDHISHTALLQKLHSYPAVQRVIKAWLKAGILEDGGFHETIKGTPQGGVASPLLMNIALHGIETAIRGAFSYKEGVPQLIRYADDFVGAT
jgi:RNA-directed DNA polymerase